MDYSKITDHLYIGTTPRPEDYHTLRDMGVGLVINMRFERRPHPDPHDPPMPVLWLPSVDSPLFPISIKKLHQGVTAALETIRRGQAVYVHCHHGIHRGVAIGAAILIGLGLSAEEAMLLVKQHRQVADPHTWYIRRRIERFAAFWSQHQQEVSN
ncbi:MAG: dual specificity protein phosphatase [Anaerolineales bacterium]|jgi:protein-tyrosine phosphatase